MNLGARIRELRISKGITQRHIIKLLNKHNSWLSQVESGAVEINAEDLKRVSDVLEIPIDQFFLPSSITNSKKII